MGSEKIRNISQYKYISTYNRKPLHVFAFILKCVKIQSEKHYKSI